MFSPSPPPLPPPRRPSMKNIGAKLYLCSLCRDFGRAPSKPDRVTVPRVCCTGSVILRIESRLRNAERFTAETFYIAGRIAGCYWYEKIISPRRFPTTDIYIYIFFFWSSFSSRCNDFWKGIRSGERLVLPSTLLPRDARFWCFFFLSFFLSFFALLSREPIGKCDS